MNIMTSPSCAPLALTVVELRAFVQRRRFHRSRSIPDGETPVGAARQHERLGRRRTGREGGGCICPGRSRVRLGKGGQSALAPNGGRHAKADGADTSCKGKGVMACVEEGFCARLLISMFP